MSLEVKIPSVGESVTEVTIATWLKGEGDYVEVDEAICEVESDKATVELTAEKAGTLAIKVEEGETIEVGTVVAVIDTSAAAPAGSAEAPSPEASAPAPEPQAAASSGGDKNFPSPAAKKILEEKGISPDAVSGTGKDGRITKADALSAQASAPAPKKSVASSEDAAPVMGGSRQISRQKMTGLRKTIAKRLLEAKHGTAMLTTFNEIDMGDVMAFRKKYKEDFEKIHGVKLGFMSLFTKAACAAIRKFPQVNAQIDGTDIVSFDYADVGIAVSTPKGLMVPVVRNAESMGLAELEKEILRLALKGRDGKLGIDEMQGGTFTITNGGVFGSMLSTPILNPPQSAILGMHNIVQRPWVINGEVKVRPIMYVALSYDHRIVDGKEAVGFLKTIKENIEDPARLILEI